EHAGVSMRLEYAAMRRALNSSLRGSFALKIGLSCGHDAKQGAVGVPATQGQVNPDTKYADPLMQLSLAYMLALYTPQSEEFIRANIQEIEFPERDSLILKSHQTADFKWKEELKGNEPWKVNLRLRLAQFAGSSGLIYLTDSQA